MLNSVDFRNFVYGYNRVNTAGFVTLAAPQVLPHTSPKISDWYPVSSNKCLLGWGFDCDGTLPGMFNVTLSAPGLDKRKKK